MLPHGALISFLGVDVGSGPSPEWLGEIRWSNEEAMLGLENEFALDIFDSESLGDIQQAAGNGGLELWRDSGVSNI